MVKAVIFMEGGLIDQVLCTDQIEYLIVNRDAGEAEDMGMEMTDTRGDSFTAVVSSWGENPNAEAVIHYFQQLRQGRR